jgi:hypothetical protein
MDATAGSPWLLVPPDVRSTFATISAAGPHLAASLFGRPLLGVKTGCNDAFLVRTIEHLEELTRVESTDRTGLVETELLRPIIRGDSFGERAPRDPARIIWTHDARGPRRELPPNARNLLAHWRRELESRTDLHGSQRWWSLFRTDAADSSRYRVVWPDIARTPRPRVLPAGDCTVPLNTCYVVRCPGEQDAFALAALLASPLAAAWLGVIAEPARGGYNRYVGWTVGLLPIPQPWCAARDLLAPLGQRGQSGECIDPDESTDAATRAYGFEPCTVRPLIEWSARTTS